MTYIFDGAFGTYYAASHTLPCEQAVFADEDGVLAVHRAYLDAGANAVITDAFAANLYNYPAEYAAMQRKSLELARRAVSESGKTAAVFCDVGVIIRPEEEAAAGYLASARSYAEAGGDRFIFETLDAFAPVLPAVLYLREHVPGCEIAVSFAADADGRTSAGLDALALLTEAAAYADIVGLNCVCGPAHMARLAAGVTKESIRGRHFLLMPNAGYPEREGGRMIYRDNAAYFAERLCEGVSYGVCDCAGGCCGTTPAHIAAFLALREGRKNAAPSVSLPAASRQVGPPQPAAAPVAAKLKAGQWITAVELDPPLDGDESFLLSAAAEASSFADMITVTDSPLGRGRADSLLTAALLRTRTDVPVMPHLSCRDRSLTGLRGGLTAAAMCGIRNVLCVTGDSPQGPGNRGVFHCNSRQLLAAVKSLNENELTGRPLTAFAALNVNAANFGAELKKAAEKTEAGAGAFITQSIFTDEAVENLRRAHETLGVPVLAGILPTASYRNALFLANEVPGIVLPESFIRSLEGKDRDEVAELSASYAVELIEKCRPFCEGVCLMTPLKRIDIVRAIASRLPASGGKPS